MRKMIEFYWHLPLVDLSDTHIAEATKFINEHFAIIKSDDELYNYQDILVMARKLMKKKKYHSLLIDPYNSLKIDLHSKSKLSTHEYHYEVVSDMKLFVSKEECCIYLNCHVITSAARMIKGEKELEAPHKADIEGGQKFANKADDFLTIHRHVGNADKYMQTEVHVRKIKETETGGKVTPFESPIILTANKALTGWTDINGNNPIKSIRGKIVDNYGSRPLTPIRDITEAKKESQSVMYNPNTQEFVPITNNETNEPIPF